MMFGKKEDKVQKLEKKLGELTKKLEETQQKNQEQIKNLRRQLLNVASGFAPSPKSILEGLAYSEISKEEVPDFIQSIPDLLILDVRGDEGWNQGYIPNAKHVPAKEVFQRLDELSDKARPILTLCANGNTAVTVCQLLAREGYLRVYNALGGMAGYQGKLIRPEIKASDVTAVKGSDRKLIQKVIEVIDRDVRPGLKRDGGDLEVIAVESGVVKVKMVGACVGCGAQKRTVEEGIKKHLKQLIPEIDGIEDLSLGIPN